MNILWLAWKDYTHPKYGGAEIALRELVKRQVADGHHVTVLTSRPQGSAARETLDGVTIIRVGSNRYLHPFQALLYYLKHLRGKFDTVIETVNTAPYFSLFFRGHAKGFALYHQLARDVWHFETSKPFNYFGYYVMEPLATWLLGRAHVPLITVSDSTKRDIARFGWERKKMHLISEGIEIQPVPSLKKVKKFQRPTVLSLGAMRGMKRTLDQIKAFEFAKQKLGNLQLKLAGDASSDYGRQVLRYIDRSPYRDDIEYLGRVDTSHKIDLMRRSHVIAVTSVKEGWGLIVTEAASQGTPAVVYDADGLRDSVQDEITGIVTRPTPQALGWGIISALTDHKRYHSFQKNGWEWSKHLNFDQSYQDLKHITEALA